MWPKGNSYKPKRLESGQALTLWQLCCCKLKVCCGQEMKATMSLLNKSFIKRNIYQGLPCHIDPLKVRSEVEAALMFLILNLIQQKKKKKKHKDILTSIDFFFKCFLEPTISIY